MLGDVGGIYTKPGTGKPGDHTQRKRRCVHTCSVETQHHTEQADGEHASPGARGKATPWLSGCSLALLGSVFMGLFSSCF